MSKLCQCLLLAIIFNFVQILNADFTTTIDLVSLSVPDGTRWTGNKCPFSCMYDTCAYKCSLRAFICITDLNGSKQGCKAGAPNSFSLQNQGQLLTKRQNTISFSNATYGNWNNPQLVTISSTDNKGFTLYCSIWDDTGILVDNFAVQVSTNNDSFVNFTHPRPNGAEPTNIQFTWVNPHTTTTVPPTTTSPKYPGLVGVIMDLIFVNDTDGKLYNGQPSSCDMYMTLCFKGLDVSPTETCYHLDDLGANSCSYTFSANTVYGNWSNPQTVYLSDPTGFSMGVKMFDQGKYLIDEYTLLVIPSFPPVVDYLHQRPTVKPTELKFSWGMFANLTTTRAPTTKAPIVCHNGGTASADGNSCICPSHYTGTTCDSVICENGGTPSGSACLCSINYGGTFCETVAYRDCNDVYKVDATDGVKTVYMLQSNKNVPVNVYCQKGWLVVQQ